MTSHIRSIAMTFVVAVFTFTGAAMAQSFTGNWPANVTHSQRSNGTDCLSLTDNGSYALRIAVRPRCFPMATQFPGISPS